MSQPNEDETPGGTEPTPGRGGGKPKGKRPPGRPRKATEELVDLAEAMLPKAVKAAVKAAIMKQGGCSARTAEDVISRARERFRQQANEPVDLLRGKYLALYDSIAFNGQRDEQGRPRASNRDRIMAASAASKLLGLEVHTHAPTASKDDLLKQFLEDPDTRAATFGAGMTPSAPPAGDRDA